MIRLTQQELDSILADFLGKPYCRGGSGPDGYDCYGLTRAFMSKIGIEIADIGKVDPKDSRPIYERQQTDFIRLPVPRPWSLVTFSSKSLDAHIGVVLPGDGVFLHCPGRAAGRVLAEPLSRRPWRDCVDGYWWPKGYIETIVLLTPMTTTKKAWQFVKTGRCLAEIVEQDITEGRDVQVQVFLGGELIPQEKWIHTVPTEMDQIVVRPLMEGGKQAGMMAGMMALAVLAPYAAGAIVPSVAAGTATAGQVLAYNLASAAIMMGGGLALSALVNANEGDRNSSQHYSAEPQTTAGIGSFIPLVYGTFGVRGVLICSYASSSYTTAEHLWRKETIIHHASDLYHAKIALSDGPIDGVIAGTEKLNDRDLEYYSGDAGFKIEYFNGTDDQSASSILDAFEIPVSLDCPTNEPVTKLFTAVDCDSAAIVLRFPNGITDYDSDGSSGFTQVQLKVEIRIAEGSWHTLMNGYIKGDSQDPMRYNIDLAGSHEGGTPFYIVAGTQYEAKVTRLSNTHSDKGDNFLFECIQFGYNTAQKHPGLAYTAIGAMASKDISGSIQYYAKIKGKLVRVYDSNTETWSIEWSDNPAWIAYDILTRPVISGNGESATPYYVEYYRRLNPSYLNLSDFVAFADWCDEEVPDGQGGVEKRYVFNGVFDQDNTAWEQAIRVCRVGCAAPFFRGHRIGIVIDKPGLPSQMFNVSNLRSGFNETWFDTSEAATVFDVSFANEQGEYIVEPYPVPLAGAELDIPVTMDGFGHTKRTQVWRRATRDLRVNHYMKRTVEIPACLDSIYTDLGQIVYVQHPALNRAIGGRILKVYDDGVDLSITGISPGTGLIGHWRLNDSAANTDVTDSSGNERTGTATHNTDTLSASGKIGECFKFDNTVGNYVTVPGRTEWSLASGGTICFWLKWGGVNASINSARPRVVHTSAWTVYLTGTADLRFRIGAEETICQIPVNEWVYVTIQVQASGHKIYLNGEDATTTGGITTLPTSSNPVFWIGAYSSTQGFLDDYVDDVRLYSRVLSEAEIQALYNRDFEFDRIKFDKPAVMLGTGLVGHWRLNDCAADTDVVDSSGNDRTGTAGVNTNTLSIPGKIGGGFQFTAADQKDIEVAHHTSLSISGGGCVAFWLKQTVRGTTHLMGKGFGWSVFVHPTSHVISSYMNASAESKYSYSTAIPLNTWVHVICHFSSSSRKIYINGVDATVTEGENLNPNAVSDKLVFGNWRVNAPYDYCNACLDDIRIYSRVLSDEEALALYNRGFGTEEEGAADHALLVRTHDGTAERLTLYEADSVSGDDLDIIKINGVWEYIPNENDLATFGVEEKVIDLYRVKAVERDSNGQVLIRGTQYTTDFYSEDEDVPKVQAQVYSETKGGISPTLLPTTAEALKISLPDASSSLGTLTWSGLAFTGDGVDTVTWECTGSGIKYQGTWVPIEDDAVGTTDKYIYFDPDPDSVGDPRYLQHTNDLADLRGFERYVMCLNINGVAYPKSGLLIGADGKTIDADDISDGSRGLKEFHDYFQDPHGTFAVRWPNATPNGITMSIEAGGASGDNLLRIASDGSGNALLTYRNSIPFDPGYLYRVRARIRANSGTPLVSIGLAGRNATDAAWVNTAGNNLQTIQHYAACFEHEPASSWEVVTGYIYGLDATGTEESSSDPENPGKMHTNVRWFRPTIVVNFQSASGVVDIDELNVDVMPPTMGSVRPTVTDQGAVGNGIIDDTNALRTAIAVAILSKRPVILPKGTYRITDTIEIGDGLSVISGLTIQAEGWESAKIIWDGDPDKNMIEILSCNGLVLDNIWLDGDNVSGVTGVYHSTGAAASSQFTTLRRCGIVNCPGVGYHIEQVVGVACDYFSFDNCVLGYNGINLKIEGGARQVEMYGGANINAATYGVEVVDGRFTVYDGLFAINGYDADTDALTGCDIYMSGLISQIQVFGASSESLVFLDGDWAADAGSSRLLSANVIHNLNQADRSDMPVGELEGAAAIDVTINYDCPRPLILTGCKVMGDISIGSKCSSVQSIHTDFYNYQRASDDDDPITGFIGAGATKVNIIGRTDNGEGTGEGSLTPTTILGGGRFLCVEDNWLKGIDLLDNGGTVYRRMGFSDGVPDTYYARVGWIVFAVNPTEAGALGWVCTVAGTPTTVKATFKAFGTNLIGATVTNYARNSILTAEDAAALQAALSFGTMAAQNANNVNISGGAIAGITDLAVADGGTGASTAAGAASNLGLGTEDSPQFTAINVGHASDTAIARASAGNITVAGNAIYRAGGTDVPVTDGGTGSSTAAGARGNLGIGAIATLADAPTAITSNTDAASGDSGKHYTNTGAGGSIHVKFPAATAGMIFAATRTASQAFWIKPYTGEQFRGQVADKYLELTSDGMTVICKCIQTGIWDIVAAGLGTTAWIGP